VPRRTPTTRPGRDDAAAQLEPDAGSGRVAAPSGTRRGKAPAPPAQEVTGVVGDASGTGTRSGEDTRRRGWFWHWNNIVTQYAPMIGLKGVGLINSYTVWTDRRESSPHRGYAFPSQQSEADFYGEDRAELITINKILVALDLIEIRKEMVLRVDERGRRWKVPHNFYRVKDHGDDFTLTAGDVMKVAALADADRAVYRYLRRMFSPKFAPIDSQNVWHRILEEVRETEVWQRLAARTAKDESKASARSKAGHAARRGSAGSPVFSVPEAGDIEESEATATDSDNDSTTGDIRQSRRQEETSVAGFNTGLETIDDGSNSGLAENRATFVDAGNTAGATSVQPSNSMYYESLTTTTTDGATALAIDPVPEPAHGPGPVPDDARTEARAIRHFEEANDRVSTPAERRLLRQLAAGCEAAATESGMSGWEWLALAVDDAVAAGSSFVAPRRLREIVGRWERDGLPAEYAPAGTAPDKRARAGAKPVTDGARASHRPAMAAGERPAASRGAAEPGKASRPTGPGVAEEDAFVAPVFTIAAGGMTNRQVWAATLSDLQFSGAIGRADVSTWLRAAAVLAVGEDGTLTLGVPHDLARRRASGRYLAAIRQALARVTGIEFAVEIVLFREWAG